MMRVFFTFVQKLNKSGRRKEIRRNTIDETILQYQGEIS